MFRNITFSFVVKAAAAVTALLTTLFAALYNYIDSGIFLTPAITTGTTCYHFSMRLLVGFLVPLAAKGKISPDSFWFRSRRREASLYRSLKVRRWKGKMPTYSPEAFSIEKNTMEQIVINSCEAELVHEVIVLFSFLPILASRLWGSLPVFLITSLLAAAFDCAFIIMQRYNRPRLQKLAKMQHRAAQK